MLSFLEIILVTTAIVAKVPTNIIKRKILIGLCDSIVISVCSNAILKMMVIPNNILYRVAFLLSISAKFIL